MFWNSGSLIEKLLLSILKYFFRSLIEPNQTTSMSKLSE